MKRLGYFFWLGIYLGALIAVCLAIVGCIPGSPDSNTGEQRMMLDPNIASLINTGAGIVELVIPAAKAASVVWPIAGTVATAFAGLLGGWGFMKDKVVKAETKTQQTKTVTKGVIRGVQAVKEDSPAAWKKAKEKFKDILGDEGSAVIEVLREELAQEARDVEAWKKLRS